MPGTTPTDSASRLSRRAALSRAATFAAARALAPVTFAGCSVGLPSQARKVLVGTLHSQTGTTGVGGRSLRDVELHAFEEINKAGGILGRQVEMLGPNPGSRADRRIKLARRMLEQGAVAIFGCWTSASRKSVLPVMEEAKRLLLYPVQYEGNESSPYCVYGGMVPNQQLLPTLDWLESPAGGSRRRILLVGSDYVFPRTAHYVTRRYLAGRELKVVGEFYRPLGDQDFTLVARMLEEFDADCVLNTVNGDSNEGFFKALAEAGIDPEKTPVMSTSIAEDELRSLPPVQVKGHYAVSSYFQRLATPANREWVAGFQEEFGHDRVTGDPMEPDWCLVHLWKQAVEKAGSFSTEAVRQAFRDNLEFAGPGGTVRLDPKTQHTTKFCRIGRIRSDRQFDLVWESPEPIVPDPYPAFAFPGWKCDWTAGGITRGPEVSIDGEF
jgi:urea transport system substrate-binding protein